MNGRRLLSRYWLIVPLILVAIVVRDFVERPDTFEIEDTIDMRRGEADYYLEDFTTRRFDADGVLEYKVSGDSLSHFAEDDRSEVVGPRVELRRPGALWNVAAERGRLDTDPDVFTLLGEVRVARAPEPPGAVPSGAGPPESGPAVAQEALTILTSDLSFDVDADEIATDRPFEIVADSWRLAGVGLRSTIGAGKLELLSNVNGTYDAAAPP